MLQVARLSPTLLGDAADLTAGFLAARLNPDGGFQDRDGASDLYYTVFGLEALTALRRDLPTDAVRRYLERHTDPARLDFVHTACLARCWADIGAAGEAPAAALLARLETYRTPDGGYSPTDGAGHGTAYGCFLALGAYEDLGAAPGRSRPSHRVPGRPACRRWRVRQPAGHADRPDAAHRRGGDRAAAPRPARRCAGCRVAAGAACAGRRVLRGAGDAIARSALDGHGPPCAGRRACPARGHPGSPASTSSTACGPTPAASTAAGAMTWQDCEYTFYALLALGHLSL